MRRLLDAPLTPSRDQSGLAASGRSGRQVPFNFFRIITARRCHSLSEDFHAALASCRRRRGHSQHSLQIPFDLKGPALEFLSQGLGFRVLHLRIYKVFSAWGLLSDVQHARNRSMTAQGLLAVGMRMYTCTAYLRASMHMQTRMPVYTHYVCMYIYVHMHTY